MPLPHAVVSAWLSYDHSRVEAKTLGDYREYATYWKDIVWNGQPWQWDNYRDLYNSRVGLNVADYVKENGLGREQIGNLVFDAMQNGHLITLRTDARIDPAFSGAPGDFVGDVRWTRTGEAYSNEPVNIGNHPENIGSSVLNDGSSNVQFDRDSDGALRKIT